TVNGTLTAAPPGVVTVIGPSVAPAGTRVTIWVAVFEMMSAGTPLNVTPAPKKSVPVIVTSWATEPPDGEKLVTVGAGRLTTIVATRELFERFGSVTEQLTVAVSVTTPPQPVTKISGNPSPLRLPTAIELGPKDPHRKSVLLKVGFAVPVGVVLRNVETVPLPLPTTKSGFPSLLTSPTASGIWKFFPAPSMSCGCGPTVNCPGCNESPSRSVTALPATLPVATTRSGRPSP